MELIRENWDTLSIAQLEDYLQNLSRPEKEKWTRNILRTSLPLLAIESPTIKKMAQQIHKGNYKSFYKNCNFSTYDMTTIFGYLLNLEKDFSSLKHYLNIYIPHVDCWASCDILKFNTKYFEGERFSLAQEYIKSPNTFTRRIGLKIMFAYTNNYKYTPQILHTLNLFYNEKEYYVNMIVAWLFCEMFIKQREATLKFLEGHKLNNFTINKGIQKCRDSHRVSNEDKEMLLKYKKPLD